MFLGQFYHNLDEKGRLTIPSKFRELLGPEGAFVMQGFDHNLMVLPAAIFETLSARINSMSITNPSARKLRRMVFATATKVDVDKVGRILIPQFLRHAAELDGSAIIVGSGGYFEIWASERWEEQQKELEEIQNEPDLFESLDLPPVL